MPPTRRPPRRDPRLRSRPARYVPPRQRRNDPRSGNTATPPGSVRRGNTVSEMTAGDKPSRASVSAKLDVNPATVTSQAANSPRPPARTLPSTLATTGLSISTIWRNNATRRATTLAGPPSRAPSARSAPAQNVLDVWVSTTARTVSSASMSRRCPASSPTSRALNALRFSGESNVSVAIRSAS